MSKCINTDGKNKSARKVTQLWKEIGGSNVDKLLQLHADDTSSVEDVKKFHNNYKTKALAKKKLREARRRL